MCQGLNSHYFHIIGDKLINPIVGVYIPIFVGWVGFVVCWNTRRNRRNSPVFPYGGYRLPPISGTKKSQVRAITVMQGYYGAYSAKPHEADVHTPVPTVGGTDAEGTYQWTSSYDLVLIGRSSDGKFKTSGLKTYPAGLCQAIATAWGHSFLLQTRNLPDGDSNPTVQMERVFQSLHSVVVDDAALGPDFCTEAQFQPAWAELSSAGRVCHNDANLDARRLRIDFSREKKKYIYI